MNLIYFHNSELNSQFNYQSCKLQTYSHPHVTAGGVFQLNKVCRYGLKFTELMTIKSLKLFKVKCQINLYKGRINYYLAKCHIYPGNDFKYIISAAAPSCRGCRGPGLGPPCCPASDTPPSRRRKMESANPSWKVTQL